MLTLPKISMVSLLTVLGVRAFAHQGVPQRDRVSPGELVDASGCQLSAPKIRSANQLLFSLFVLGHAFRRPALPRLLGFQPRCRIVA